MAVLERLFIKGFHYKRAGVMVSGLCADSAIQMSFLDIPEERRERYLALSRLMDEVNACVQVQFGVTLEPEVRILGEDA